MLFQILSKIENLAVLDCIPLNEFKDEKNISREFQMSAINECNQFCLVTFYLEACHFDYYFVMEIVLVTLRE